MAALGSGHLNPAPAAVDHIVEHERILVVHHADRIARDVFESVVMDLEIFEIAVGDRRMSADTALKVLEGAAGNLHIPADGLVIDRIVSVEMLIAG